jgi:hypothetical protein
LGPPHRIKTVAGSIAALINSAMPLAAEEISINFGWGRRRRRAERASSSLSRSGRVQSLAPSILVTITSFTPP